MIFVTVGTQLPYERLIKAMDEWAAQNPHHQVFAQIGDTQYSPKHMETTRLISPQDYQLKLAEARVIVGHVGMGTIISGVEHKKPLVLMPRRFDLGEHRNDHQRGSAQMFGKLAGISIVENSEQLKIALEARLSAPAEGYSDQLKVSGQLIERISGFVSEHFELSTSRRKEP
ncbi:glycosyltransferase [Marinobacterium mangrovicola]|uniref:UDP-N-acetylglucosamine transferase subunit ALG13 n=1 Tax=Marinobacterium mangrovicola TaxID=1476959 RepID=A0A4R1GMP0_9GAMM|nr:glycosyltransferase [Marinobacterium mangrovicola]TCK07549.1 UDP-N-acetylglucosamine transferase subunit ALG13 [Marinobacterium mangrovicola]